ncbi:hypothetical protein AVEN_247935-1 [Araneus ventricosus]|uniref:Uncharacterized protein n=1 Tax=Araneus ventricosus TaxID=182803 RepID=A0A4Y2CI20_ARAVE|nr:hypothetical protein AVEN_247935-1 [Araneus ventricosus]
MLNHNSVYLRIRNLKAAILFFLRRTVFQPVALKINLKKICTIEFSSRAANLNLELFLSVYFFHFFTFKINTTCQNRIAWDPMKTSPGNHVFWNEDLSSASDAAATGRKVKEVSHVIQVSYDGLSPVDESPFRPLLLSVSACSNN